MASGKFPPVSHLCQVILLTTPEFTKILRGCNPEHEGNAWKSLLQLITSSPLQPEQTYSAGFATSIATLSNLTVHNHLESFELLRVTLIFGPETLNAMHKILEVMRGYFPLLILTVILPLMSDFTGRKVVAPNTSKTIAEKRKKQI